MRKTIAVLGLVVDLGPWVSAGVGWALCASIVVSLTAYAFDRPVPGAVWAHAPSPSAAVSRTSGSLDSRCSRTVTKHWTCPTSRTSSVTSTEMPPRPTVPPSGTSLRLPSGCRSGRRTPASTGPSPCTGLSSWLFRRLADRAIAGMEQLVELAIPARAEYVGLGSKPRATLCSPPAPPSNTFTPRRMHSSMEW